MTSDTTPDQTIAAPRRRPVRILLLGGTSEIGLAILAALGAPEGSEMLLAGRDEQRLAAAGKSLPYGVSTLSFDATALDTHEALIDEAFAGGPVDLVISAAGVLIPQEVLDADPRQAGLLIETNFTGHVTTLLAAAQRMRRQGRGTIVVLSSVAAVRPRKANFVYGAAKAGLDAFARGLADSLHGSGVRLLLVRPAEVGTAVAAALRSGASQVWVPRALGPMAAALRAVPRPLWRQMRR
jgi:decaprenylphospho-beta-D-erythro-pentofuranosid-2-ulose 2-reductase